MAGFEIFENLLSSWFCKKSIEFNIVTFNIFQFLKQSLAFFNYKHLATLTPILLHNFSLAWQRWNFEKKTAPLRKCFARALSGIKSANFGSAFRRTGRPSWEINRHQSYHAKLRVRHTFTNRWRQFCGC